MSKNRLRETWLEGRAAFGAWCSTPASLVAEVMGREDVDYVAVDCQHGLIDYAVMVTMLQSIALSARTPVVRVPSNDATSIGRVLDAGAEMVIVPGVNTALEAAQAVQACRYPPNGVRSFGPTRSGMFLGSDPEIVNAEVACFVMIETSIGLTNLDSICSTKGLDGIYIGPADLSLALGGVPSLRNQSADLIAAIDEIRKVCRRESLVAGIPAADGAQAADYARRGFQLITIASDIALLRQSLRSEVAIARAVSKAS